MDLYTFPSAQQPDAENPIVKQKVSLAESIVTVQYEHANADTSTWTVDLNDIRNRPDFRNHVCYILAPDATITNLYEDVVKLGILNTAFFASKGGFVLSIIVQDNPKENPIISLVLSKRSTTTLELTGDLILAGDATDAYYPLGNRNTNP